MQTLFPLAPQYPAGFLYRSDFISAAEEAGLLQLSANLSLHPFQFQGYEAKRRVASFGFDWNFERQQLSKGKEIPTAFAWLVERVAHFLSLAPSAFAELLVTEYPVGAVINWHRDAPPFALIAGISLGADCQFKLRPHDKTKQTRKAVVTVPVQRRSLYVMQKEARTEWQHSIPAVNAVRHSITLRTVY